jgi:predicted metalloendopeptidase
MTDSATCPCCKKNPWAQATGDWFAQLCTDCVEDPNNKKESAGSFGIDRANLDDAIQPPDNFYRWANGGWMTANPIPPGYPSWNTFTRLHSASQEQCRALLEDLAKSATITTTTTTTAATIDNPEHVKLAAFYAAALDEAAIEAQGVAAPLAKCLALVDAIVTASEDNPETFARLLGQLSADYGTYMRA